jgi:hypothetical protein
MDVGDIKLMSPQDRRCSCTYAGVQSYRRLGGGGGDYFVPASSDCACTRGESAPPYPVLPAGGFH